MELSLLAAVLNTRTAYDNLIGKVATSDFSEYGQVILREAFAYYKRDEAAQSVDRGLLASSLQGLYKDAKLSGALLDYVDDIPREVSAGAVTGMYRDLRRQNIGLRLADQFVKGDHGVSTAKLLAKYNSLGDDDAIEESWKPRLTFEDIFSDNRQGKISVYPRRLNDALNGGIRPGHNVLIFGRPGAGKTLVAVNLCAGIAAAGHHVLYVGNEEPLQSLQYRFLSRLGRERLSALDAGDDGAARAAYKRAEARASARGFANVSFVHGENATSAIERYIQRVKPRIIVVDQIRHAAETDDGLARGLETVARIMREWAHKYEAITIGVTQAGNSAEGRQILGMTDIDFSKTGAQGACDLMIGVGVTDDMKRQHKRILSICRNKISGVETTIPIWIDEQYTAVRNKPREQTHDE